MFGVYRILKNGKHVYVNRSATNSLKLAQDIADDRSAGRVTMPDGSTKMVPARPHIAKAIEA